MKNGGANIDYNYLIAAINFRIMNNEQRIIDYMVNYEPEQTSFKDGVTYYTDTLKTHTSYAMQLTTAPKGSLAYKMYLSRAFDWLKLLKKHNVKLQNKIN